MTNTDNFDERAYSLMSLYEQRKYLEAIELANHLAAEFPERDLAVFWQICLYSVSGQTAQALRILEEGLSRGFWWSAASLHEDEDLASLQGNPEFERLVAISAERHAREQALRKPELFVHRPEGVGPFPLLIVLHGRMSAAQSDFDKWKLALDRGWILAMPQSSQISSMSSYLWDDNEKASNEVEEHRAALIKNHPVDRNRVVLAGFSQGAALAMHLVMSQRLNARGFIAVVPGGVNLDSLSEWAGSASGLRGVLVAGGLDPRYERFKKIKAIFAEHSLPLLYEEYPEMGHEYPQDFEHVLEKGLNFVLDIE